MTDLFTDGQPEKKARAKKENAEAQDVAHTPTEEVSAEIGQLAAESGQSTDLVIAGVPLVPTVVFAAGGSADVLRQLRERVLAEKTDISTPKGRQAIKSLVYRVARTKTGLDQMGKDLGDMLRKQLDPILEERRKIREGCDEIAELVRAPLTAWEASEEKRINAHHDAIDEIDKLAVFDTLEPGSAIVKERLEQLDNLPDRDWQEFIQRAVEVKKGIRADLESYLQQAQAREEAAAEIARMEAEAAAAEAERLRLEREAELAAAAEQARIAAEAAAAEEAERVAEAARLEAARVAEAAEAERQRIEAQRQAEEAAKLEAERLLKEERDRAEQKRKDDHRRALEMIVGMANDAASPMNDSSMIKHVTTYFETMEELKRNFEEFQSEADQTIKECRERIAERLKKQEGFEAEREAARAKDAEAEAERVRQAGIQEEARRRDEALATERAAAEQRARDEKRRKEVHDDIAAVLVNLANLNTLSNAGEIADALMAGKVPHVTVIF